MDSKLERTTQKLCWPWSCILVEGQQTWEESSSAILSLGQERTTRCKHFTVATVLVSMQWLYWETRNENHKAAVNQNRDSTLHALEKKAILQIHHDREWLNRLQVGWAVKAVEWDSLTGQWGYFKPAFSQTAAWPHPQDRGFNALLKAKLSKAQPWSDYQEF